MRLRGKPAGTTVELTDAQAAERAARGDAEAFMVLVRRYRAPLIGYIHGRLRRRNAAEDVAQEAFCKAWEHLPELREPGAFGGWLYRIAANTVKSESRRATPVSLDHEPVAEGRTVEPSMNHSVDVHRAIGMLSEEQRVVVSLRYFTDLSTDEIARVLETKPGTVRSRLSRAYGELRRHLAEHVAEREV